MSLLFRRITQISKQKYFAQIMITLHDFERDKAINVIIKK